MATLSIRIPDDLLDEADRHARELKMARAEYIRTAIERLNGIAAAERKREMMRKASQKVRAESMRVLKEFEDLSDELP